MNATNTVVALTETLSRTNTAELVHLCIVHVEGTVIGDAFTDVGTVDAPDLTTATDLAVLDAFAGVEIETPDVREPGLVTWACLAGATVLRVEPV